MFEYVLIIKSTHNLVIVRIVQMGIEYFLGSNTLVLKLLFDVTGISRIAFSRYADYPGIDANSVGRDPSLMYENQLKSVSKFSSVEKIIVDAMDLGCNTERIRRQCQHSSKVRIHAGTRRYLKCLAEKVPEFADRFVHTPEMYL